MNRFYINPKEFEQDKIEIVGDDFKHLSKVLRLKAGEEVEIYNNNGLKSVGRIEDILKNKAIISLLDKIPTETENSYQTTLFQSYPKGSKLETIAQKTTENGINRIVPFYSTRSVVKPSKSEGKKIERIKKIVKGAGEQSGRGIIPEVKTPLNFKNLLKELDEFDLVLVAYETENKNSLKNTLEGLDYKPENIAIVIGPEGGFEESEIEALKDSGAKVVSLGNRILRTETAGMVLLSQLNFFYE